MNEQEAGSLLQKALRAGVRACHPETCLEEHLPDCSDLPEDGRVILLAGGKAAGAMMRVAVRFYGQRIGAERLCGVAVGKSDGYVPVSPSNPSITWIGAGHPVPDEGSLAGAQAVLNRADAAGERDLVVVLLSGGASSLWSAPVAGVSLADKQNLTRLLLRSGADIAEINCVRKHLSAIKGGRLAARTAPARLVVLSISDVVGDDPSIIASGPCTGDPTSLAEARAILDRHAIVPAGSIRRALADPCNETPWPSAPLFANSRNTIVANGARALAAAEKMLTANGVRIVNLGDRLKGEARELARRHARLVRSYQQENQPVALLSGGELTVTVRGSGRGGPSQEYALALAIALEGTPEKGQGKETGGAGGIFALAADTDGCDGGQGDPGDPAGALIYPSTLARARAKKLNPATFLADNDSGTFFKRLGDHLTTGPTHTNVNDFRLILVAGSQTGDRPETGQRACEGAQKMGAGSNKGDGA